MVLEDAVLAIREGSPTGEPRTSTVLSGHIQWPPLYPWSCTSLKPRQRGVFIYVFMYLFTGDDNTESHN